MFAGQKPDTQTGTEMRGSFILPLQHPSKTQRWKTDICKAILGVSHCLMPTLVFLLSGNQLLHMPAGSIKAFICGTLPVCTQLCQHELPF